MNILRRSVLSSMLQQPAAIAATAAAMAATAAADTVQLKGPAAGSQLCCSHQWKLFTTSSWCFGGFSDAPEVSDTYYWVPPQEEQALTPSSISQRRATGRLESALDAVLTGDGYLREHLVNQYGFNIHRVRLAKDRRTVFILWDSNPGKAKACQQALERNAFRLRRDLAKVLRSKHTPYLEFRHDHLPPLQAAVAASMEAIEQEEMATAAAAQNATAAASPHSSSSSSASDSSAGDHGSSSSSGGGSSSSSGGGSSSSSKGIASGSDLGRDIDAAIARLESLTGPRS